ncbi:MAG TPA: alpha/beta hydrolase [Burkholderiaceae bacterium]|nr:alpha/beta hydrolase [Burkholderiaceae bacterium]
MKFIDVGGVPTRCWVAGPPGAPGLLLIHGLTITCDIWLRNLEALAERHHVIAPDMPGHGFTRPTLAPEKVDVGAKVDHLAALMETVGHRRYGVCASSYGALIAFNLYFAHPARVERLIINGSGSAFNTEPQLVDAVRRTHENYAPCVADSHEAAWRERLARTMHDGSAIPEPLPTLLTLAYAQPWIAPYWHETIASMSDPRRFARYRVLERLADVQVDTCVFWGRDDRGASLESARDCVAKLPRGRLIVYDRCGHFPMVEHAARFHADLQSFIDRREPGRDLASRPPGPSSPDPSPDY